jgi:predicted aspartyl protease
VSSNFEPTEGLIVVSTRLWGPRGHLVVRLALDTGATDTLLKWDVVASLGYDPTSSPARVRITTASGVESVPQVEIDKLEALGKQQEHFPVLCHALPPGIAVDGLLGLDFFRGQRLVMDFRTGSVTLD